LGGDLTPRSPNIYFQIFGGFFFRVTLKILTPTRRQSKTFENGVEGLWKMFIPLIEWVCVSNNLLIAAATTTTTTTNKNDKDITLRNKNLVAT